MLALTNARVVVTSVDGTSRWLDVLDDANLDDVDRWELGLHDGETSRYTSAWSSTCKGRTLHCESKRTVSHPISGEGSQLAPEGCCGGGECEREEGRGITQSRDVRLRCGAQVCRNACPPADRFMGSVRAEAPRPRTGVHYFEVRALDAAAGFALERRQERLC